MSTQPSRAATGIRARAGNLLAVLAGLALALLLSEAGVRLFWNDAPAVIAREDSLPLQQIRDPEILYRLVPGSTGYYNGTEVSVNSMGLRDRDFPIPKPPGAGRILVLGDSMVFGVGLPPGKTLSARLSEFMRPDEAINAGIFGYNLKQEIALLRDVGLAYQPSQVVACFVHNDIENWGLGDGGAVPEIKSSRFSPPPAEAWSTRLADRLLPGAFDADRLNLLPAGQSAQGARGWLSSHSRLYLFTYLRLRTHSWNLTGGEQRDPLIDSPSCQTEELIWGGLAAQYRKLRQMVERSGARLVVVIHGGLLWEGGPARRLRELLKKEGIGFLDLSPVWLDRPFYAAHYSLGWDPHPNEQANLIAASLVADHLRSAGDTPGPHDVIAARADLADRLAQWRRREDELVAAEDARWRDTVTRFRAVVDLGDAHGDRGQAGQILYGFWDGATGPAPPSGAGTGRWMSPSGSLLLKRAGGERRVVIDLAPPAGPAGADWMPRTLRVTLGAPPGSCGAQTLELPVDSLERGPGGTYPARLTAELPASLAGENLVEVGLSVDHAFPATYLDPDRRDPRLVSFFVRRVALE